jgi:hypothetical protein
MRLTVLDQRRPGALLSSDDLRVERRASGEASSVMTSEHGLCSWQGRGGVALGGLYLALGKRRWLPAVCVMEVEPVPEVVSASRRST